MLHHYLRIIFYFLPFLVISQNLDPDALEDEISKLNDHHQYETSLLKLDRIIQDPGSRPFDRTHAYIQKSLTYKRVYNYIVAINNLDKAEVEAQKSSRNDELESRIWAEKMFVYFDMQDGESVLKLLEKFDSNRVSHLTRETLALYYTVTGFVSSWGNDYKQAHENFDQAIAILEKDNPKHLPNVYRAKLALYSEQGEYTKVMQAFEKGLYYATKYDVEIYDIIMHEGLTKHYKDTRDYENAVNTQKLVSEKRLKYDASSNSEKLLSLESNLDDQRKSLELEIEKKRQLYLTIIILTITVLIAVLLLLLRVSKQKNKLILNENRYIRQEVERLSAEIDMQTNSEIALESHKLTERQLEVIKLVKEGKTNKEIGAELFISENTIKYHLKTIYELLGVENRIVLRQNFNL